MISDREISQAAGVMVKRYGEDAATEAEFRADALLVEGDAKGYAIWRRIMEAIDGRSGSGPDLREKLSEGCERRGAAEYERCDLYFPDMLRVS